MNTKSDVNVVAKRGWSHFVAMQVIVIGVIVALGAYRLRVLHERQQLPPLREEPLSFGPLYDYEVVVSREQLQRVLLKLRPRLYGKDTILGHVDHALRFWGTEADFKDPEFVSGNDLRQLLLDHRRFAEVYGPDTPSLLIDKGGGVAVRTQEGDFSASHTDHPLACLAEVGTPLSYPVITPGRQTTFRAIVEQSLRDFSLNQAEYEWSVKTYALFLPPTTRWLTSEGQEVSFDLVADRMMREVLPRGVCMGNHRLYGLVAFLRIHDQIPIISPETRERILRFLADATQRLAEHQHPDGFWNDEWPYAAPLSREPTNREGDRLRERILATGHALEWWAMAPQELHPPRAVLVSAAQWLVRTIDSLSEDEIRVHYTYLSHAGRALALWRRQEPFDVIRDLLTKGSGETPPGKAEESPAKEVP